MSEQNNSQSRSASSEIDCRNELADRIAGMLGGADTRAVVLGCLSEYNITRKETGLIVYDGGETEYLIKRFIIAKKVKGCTDRTCKLYSQNLFRMFGKIGKSPTQCDHTDIQAVLATLIIAGTSKAYQQNIMRTFSSFYGWLTREEIIQKNIMLKIDPVRATAKHKEAFSDMDVERIRAACQTLREKALIEVLLSTGCRIFEVAKLTRQEVQQEAFTIVGKGDKERTVFMNAKAQITVMEYLAERKDDNPYLFPQSCIEGCLSLGNGGHLKGGLRWYLDPDQVHQTNHMDESSLASVIRNIGKRAGVENCHPHRFRRTCATLALRRGMPVTLVQMMLGHNSLATTQRYLDIGDVELREAHKRFVV